MKIRKQNEDLLKYFAISICVLLFLIMLVVWIFPYFAIWGRYEIERIGSIGDFWGGITAPFIGLIAAILVYVTFREQVKANIKFAEQFQVQSEFDYARVIFEELKSAISKFQYAYDDEENGGHIIFDGPEAFHRVFHDIYCQTENYHKVFTSQFIPLIIELQYILNLFQKLFDKIDQSDSLKNSSYCFIAEELLRNFVLQRLKDESGSLKKEYCEICECNHGFEDAQAELLQKLIDRVYL